MLLFRCMRFLRYSKVGKVVFPYTIIYTNKPLLLVLSKNKNGIIHSENKFERATGTLVVRNVGKLKLTLQISL